MSVNVFTVEYSNASKVFECVQHVVHTAVALGAIVTTSRLGGPETLAAERREILHCVAARPEERDARRAGRHCVQNDTGLYRASILSGESGTHETATFEAGARGQRQLQN